MAPVSDDRIGFVFISCGPYAHTFRAETCIESLCRIARWDGAVYLITDSPQCFDPETMRRISGNPNITITPVPSFTHGFDLPVTVDWKRSRSTLDWKRVSGNMRLPVPALIPPRTRSRSKAIKARVFELVPDDRIEVLIYADCDAIFTRHDKMADLLRFARDWEGKEGMKFRYQKPDPEHPGVFTPASDIHGGFFIAHRTRSARALAKWREYMDREAEWIRSAHDRDKFKSAWREVEAANPGHNYMTVYEIDRSLELEAFYRPGQEPLIAHLTFGRVRAHRALVERFVGSFGLRSFPAGYYTLPGLPLWALAIFYFGVIPFRGAYKIETVWKRWREGLGAPPAPEGGRA